MRFKTNAKCSGCTAAIIKALNSVAPAAEGEFNLASPDKTLTYIGSKNLDRNLVMGIIAKAGFMAEPLD